MATIAEKLAQAEEAYHQLMMGQTVVEVVDQNGERVKYAQASASRLAMYIATLKNQMNGTPLGPLQVYL